MVSIGHPVPQVSAHDGHARYTFQAGHSGSIPVAALMVSVQVRSMIDHLLAAVCVHVHPQTVRYRPRQVEDLFGDQLRDPDRRFELEIALRTRHMLRRKRP